MCGINGIYNFSGSVINDSENLINNMNQILSHRGPDDSGAWSDERKRIVFGQRRLSIIDLSSMGHQPMFSPKGNVIIFNGEIYNYQTVRERLDVTSYFSSTDTETILYAYEKFGEKCLDEFNGMFAFAIWDKEKEELFLARDRVGIKPLYYCVKNGIFAFSSEIKSLLSLPWINAKLDKNAFYHFLTFNKVFPPYTMFEDIYKFYPGYKMIVNRDGVKSYHPYWDIDYTNEFDIPPDRIEEKVYNELDKSVGFRMISDVPVGAFLSGGVDSSSIVALMNSRATGPVKTYSIGFESAPGYDELKYAREISQMFNTEHYEKVVSPREIEEFMPQVVDIFDEPLADATSIPIYFISKMARECGTIVVLTGDGGDELFCGYSNWGQYVKLSPYYHFLLKTPKVLLNAFLSASNHWLADSSIQEIISRAKDRQEFFWGGAGGFKESSKRNFLADEFRRDIGDLSSHDIILNLKKQFESVNPGQRNNKFIDWLCFVGLKLDIPNFYLYRADRLGMANSIEIRVPFLDHNFVRLAMNIDGNLKYKSGEPKYILKKSMERILPKSILYRKKMGFCVPLKEWTGDIITGYIEDNLNFICRETGLFDQSKIAHQIKKTKEGEQNYIFTLWNIYFIISWLKKWML